jgi:hypothetical protein
MSENDAQSDWPFPSVDAYTIRIPGKGNRMSLSGDAALILSYLEKFGCVPVFTGNPRRRKLARLNDKKEWIINEPDGTTGLELPPKIIEDYDEQIRILTEYNWYHIGYSVNPSLIEFEFNVNGEGFSRRAIWGYGTVMPAIEDFYWTYSISKDSLSIEWEDGSSTQISFSLRRQLRAASSLKGDGLAFYDMTLQVDSALFPQSASFAKYLLKEYWGQPKQLKEEI